MEKGKSKRNTSKCLKEKHMKCKTSKYSSLNKNSIAVLKSDDIILKFQTSKKKSCKVGRSLLIPALIVKSMVNAKGSLCRTKTTLLKSEPMFPNKKGTNVSNKEIPEDLQLSLLTPTTPVETKLILSSKLPLDAATGSRISHDPDDFEADKEYKFNVTGKESFNFNLSLKLEGVGSMISATINPNQAMQCNIRYKTDNDLNSLKDLKENLAMLNEAIERLNVPLSKIEVSGLSENENIKGNANLIDINDTAKNLNDKDTKDQKSNWIKESGEYAGFKDDLDKSKTFIKSIKEEDESAVESKVTSLSMRENENDKTVSNVLTHTESDDEVETTPPIETEIKFNAFSVQGKNKFEKRFVDTYNVKIMKEMACIFHSQKPIEEQAVPMEDEMTNSVNPVKPIHITINKPVENEKQIDNFYNNMADKVHSWKEFDNFENYIPTETYSFASSQHFSLSFRAKISDTSPSKLKTNFSITRKYFTSSTRETTTDKESENVKEPSNLLVAPPAKKEPSETNFTKEDLLEKDVEVENTEKPFDNVVDKSINESDNQSEKDGSGKIITRSIKFPLDISQVKETPAVVKKFKSQSKMNDGLLLNSGLVSHLANEFDNEASSKLLSWKNQTDNRNTLSTEVKHNSNLEGPENVWLSTDKAFLNVRNSYIDFNDLESKNEIVINADLESSDKIFENKDLNDLSEKRISVDLTDYLSDTANSHLFQRDVFIGEGNELNELLMGGLNSKIKKNDSNPFKDEIKEISLKIDDSDIIVGAENGFVSVDELKILEETMEQVKNDLELEKLKKRDKKDKVCVISNLDYDDEICEQGVNIGKVKSSSTTSDGYEQTIDGFDLLDKTIEQLEINLELERNKMKEKHDNLDIIEKHSLKSKEHEPICEAKSEMVSANEIVLLNKTGHELTKHVEFEKDRENDKDKYVDILVQESISKEETKAIDVEFEEVKSNLISRDCVTSDKELRISDKSIEQMQTNLELENIRDVNKYENMKEPISNDGIEDIGVKCETVESNYDKIEKGISDENLDILNNIIEERKSIVESEKIKNLYFLEDRISDDGIQNGEVMDEMLEPFRDNIDEIKSRQNIYIDKISKEIPNNLELEKTNEKDITDITQEHVSNDGVPKDDVMNEQLDTDFETKHEFISVDKLEILDKSNCELEKDNVKFSNENVDIIEQELIFNNEIENGELTDEMLEPFRDNIDEIKSVEEVEILDKISKEIPNNLELEKTSKNDKNETMDVIELEVLSTNRVEDIGVIVEEVKPNFDKNDKILSENERDTLSNAVEQVKSNFEFDTSNENTRNEDMGITHQRVSNDGVPKDDVNVEQPNTDFETKHQLVSVDKLEILVKSNCELEKDSVKFSNENLDIIEQELISNNEMKDVDFKLNGKEHICNSKDIIVNDHEKHISNDEIKDASENFEEMDIKLETRNKTILINELEIDNHLDVLQNHVSNDEITENDVKHDALDAIIAHDETLENTIDKSVYDLNLEELGEKNLIETNFLQTKISTNDLNHTNEMKDKNSDYHDKAVDFKDKTTSAKESIRKEPSIESVRDVPNQVVTDNKTHLIEIHISNAEEIEKEKAIQISNLENLMEANISTSTIKNQVSAEEDQELNKVIEQLKLDLDLESTNKLDEEDNVEKREIVQSYFNTELADKVNEENTIYLNRSPSSIESNLKEFGTEKIKSNDNLKLDVLDQTNEMSSLDINQRQASEDLASHRNVSFGEIKESENNKEEVRDNSEKQEFKIVKDKKLDKTTKQIKITSSVDIRKDASTQNLVASIKRKISVELVKGLNPDIEVHTANSVKVDEKENKKNCVCFIQRHISINETKLPNTAASESQPIFIPDIPNKLSEVIDQISSSSKPNLLANIDFISKKKLFNPFSTFKNKSFDQKNILKEKSDSFREGLETIIEDPCSNSCLDSTGKIDDSILIVKSVTLAYKEPNLIKAEKSTDEHVSLNEVEKKVKMISNLNSIISQTFNNESKPSSQISVEKGLEVSSIKQKQKFNENQGSKNVGSLENHDNYKERTLDTNIDTTSPIGEDQLIINSLCKDLCDKPIVVSSERLLYDMSPVIIIEDFDKTKTEIQTIPSIESILHQIDTIVDLQLPILFENCLSVNKIISLKVENILRSFENEFNKEDVFSDNLLEIELSMSPDNITIDYYHRDDFDNSKVNRPKTIDQELNELKTTLTDVQFKRQNKIPIEANIIHSNQSLVDKRSGVTNKCVDKSSHQHQKRLIKDNDSSKTFKSSMSLETFNTLSPNIDRQYLLHSRLCDVKYKVINHDIFSNASLSSMNSFTKRSFKSNRSDVSVIGKQDFILPLSSNYKNTPFVVNEKSKEIQDEKCKVFSIIDSNLFDNFDFGVTKLSGENQSLLNEFGNTFRIHNSIQNQIMSSNDDKSQIDSFNSTQSIDVQSGILDGRRSRVTLSTSVSSDMFSVKSTIGSSYQNDAMIDSDLSNETSNRYENYTMDVSRSNRNNRTDDSFGKIIDRTSSKSRASGQSPNTYSERHRISASTTDREEGSKKYVLIGNQADDENNLLKPMVDLDIQFGAHKHCSEDKYQRIDNSCYDNLALSIAIKYSNSICSALNPDKQEMCFKNLKNSEKSRSTENKPSTSYPISINDNESDKTSVHPHGFETDEKHENRRSHLEIFGPDKQFISHKTLSKDRFQTIDNATFTRISLSTIKRPPETNDLLPENLATDSTLSSSRNAQVLHSCNDINKVTSELEMHDNKLNKLVCAIERLDNPSICDLPMKELEDKLIDESKSYREWKQLNDPHSFDKEEFLLDVSVSIRKELEDALSGKLQNLYSLDEINAVISELNCNDMILKRLIQDINFKNDARILKKSLQELEIKLANESKSYVAWKQKHKPSCLENEQFLLEISSHFRMLMFGEECQPNTETLNKHATLQFLAPFQKEDVISDKTNILHSIDRIFSTSRESYTNGKKINFIEKRYTQTEIGCVISDLKLNDDELIQLVYDIKNDNKNIVKESMHQLEDKLTDESKNYLEWKHNKTPSQFDVEEFLVDLSSQIRHLLSENEDRISGQRLEKGSRYSEISIHIEKSPSFNYVLTMNDSESIIDLKYRETDGFKIIELTVYKDTSCEELSSIEVPNQTKNDTDGRYVSKGQIKKKVNHINEATNDIEILVISSGIQDEYNSEIDSQNPSHPVSPHSKDQIFNDKYPLSDIQESYDQITSTNDLENNIETSSIDLQIPYSLKDIQAVIADLRREDKELNKLIFKIQASDSKTSLEISLKLLDRKLLDESKSYQDWKNLNEPSSFDNEQFLIDFSSFFRKLISDNDRQSNPFSNQDTTTDQQLTKRIKHTDLPIYIDKSSPIRYELSMKEENVATGTDNQQINRTNKDGESHINKVLFELNLDDAELKNLIHDIKEVEENEGNLKPLLQELDNKLKRESVSYRNWETQEKPSSFDTETFLLDVTSEVQKLFNETPFKDLEISYTNKDIRNVISDLELDDSELKDLVHDISQAESGSELKPMIQELDDKLKKESVSYRDWKTLSKPSSVGTEKFLLAVSSEVQNIISGALFLQKSHDTSFSSKDIRSVVSELNLHDNELKNLIHNITAAKSDNDLKPLILELDDKLKRESVSYRDWKTMSKPSSTESKQFLQAVSSEVQNQISSTLHKDQITSFSNKDIRSVVSELNLQDPELKNLIHDIKEIEDVRGDLKPKLTEFDKKLSRESLTYREWKAVGKPLSFETEQFLIEVSSQIHNLISENQLSTIKVMQPNDSKIQSRMETESHLSIINEKSPSIRCVLSIIQSESVLAISPQISQISSNKEMHMDGITVDENILKQTSISISLSKTGYQNNENIKSHETTQPIVENKKLTINDLSDVKTIISETNDKKKTMKDKSLSQNDSTNEKLVIPLAKQSIETSILLAENEIVSYNEQLSSQNSSLSHTEISLEIVQSGTQIAMITHEISSRELQSNVSTSDISKKQDMSNKLPVFEEVSMELSQEIGVLDNTGSKVPLSIHSTSVSIKDGLAKTFTFEKSEVIKKKDKALQLVNENIHKDVNPDQDLIESISFNKDLETSTNSTNLEMSIFNIQHIVDKDKKPPLPPREEIMTMNLSIEKDSNSNVKSFSITMESSSKLKRQSNTITDEQQKLLDEENRNRLAKAFENDIENRLLDDMLEFLIDSSLGVILAEKSAGDDCRKPDSCISYSFENDKSEKFSDCADAPIIDYKTHISFNSKVPVKVSRHEEHSHLKLYKSDNNQDEYRLSAKSYKRTDMILSKSNKKINKDFKRPSVKISKPIPSLKCNKVKTGLQPILSKLRTDIPINSSSDGETSDCESLIPTIYQKNISSETRVKYDQAAKWIDLPKKNKDCIKTPYGYYKTEYNCYNLPLPSRSFKKQKSSGSYSQNEFEIPNDGIFGRDFTEPKFTNFCCNNCRAWINLGDRPKHQVECKGFNQNSNDSTRPKIKPRSIKRMPGIVCYICGKRFTKYSIKIHEKSCLILWNKINCSFKKQLRKPIPEKPAVGEGEIQKMINDHKAQGKSDYCAEDALNELYFISSRNHAFDLNE